MLFSRELATIDCNVPIELDPAAMRRSRPTWRPRASCSPSWSSLRW